MVRRPTAVASGGTGSLSIPSTACSAAVMLSWMTGPPMRPRSSHTPPWYAVACVSTSSPTPPTTGASWHSAQELALKSGPNPVAGVNVV